MWNYKKDLEHAFAQAVMTHYLESIDLGERLAWLRSEYRQRRDLMLSLLARYMPRGVTWLAPGGGYFIWLHTPGVNAADLLPRAVDAGIAYIPGIHFCPGSSQGREHLRLSFSFLSPEQMETGVAILGHILQA